MKTKRANISLFPVKIGEDCTTDPPKTEFKTF